MQRKTERLCRPAIAVEMFHGTGTRSSVDLILAMDMPALAAVHKTKRAEVASRLCYTQQDESFLSSFEKRRRLSAAGIKARTAAITIKLRVVCGIP